MNTITLAEQLTPIATNLFASYPASGVDADDLRWNATLRGVLKGSERPAIVSAALTRALRAAGGKPSNQTRQSSHPAAKSRRVLVWYKGA